MFKYFTLVKQYCYQEQNFEFKFYVIKRLKLLNLWDLLGRSLSESIETWNQNIKTTNEK